MVGARALVCLLSLLVLAGCSNSSPTDSGSTAKSSSSSITSGAPGSNEPLERFETPWVVTLYITADGSLSTELPSAGGVVIGTPVTAFAAGFRPPRFDFEPLGKPALLGPEDVRFVGYVNSAAPQPSNSVFDLAVWFGSNLQLGLSHIAVGAPVHAPGTPQLFDFNLEFATQRAYFVPANEMLSLIVTGQLGGEGGEPHLLVGGETPSRVELTLHNYTSDPLAKQNGVESTDFAGQVSNFSGPACADFPTARMSHDFTVHQNATYVQVVLAGTGAAPSADIDLDVSDGSTVVGGAHSPYATEGVYLAADALDGLQGRTLTAIAIACGPGALDYKFDIEQGFL